MSRAGRFERATTETRVVVEVELDGHGASAVHTPIGFLSHMLEQLGRHGALDLTVEASGDVHVDGHHTTEDVGLAVGRAVAAALGQRAGICRYGVATVPMDEALVTCALDLSGRPFFVRRGELPRGRVGDFDSDLTDVFFEALSRGAACNVHVRVHDGVNLHHIIEAAFKALGRALRAATAIDDRVATVPSTKGTLTE